MRTDTEESNDSSGSGQEVGTTQNFEINLFSDSMVLSATAYPAKLGNRPFA
jgi:hypothetical protein